MKAGIGQYIRTVGNTFEKVVDIDLSIEHVIVENKLSYISFMHISKVADTPLELVQEDDLVSIGEPTWKELILQVFKINDELYIWYSKSMDEPSQFYNIKYTGSIDIPEITKILTPNSNGGYDLQYSKEEIK